MSWQQQFDMLWVLLIFKNWQTIAYIIYTDTVDPALHLRHLPSIPTNTKWYRLAKSWVACFALMWSIGIEKWNARAQMEMEMKMKVNCKYKRLVECVCANEMKWFFEAKHTKIYTHTYKHINKHRYLCVCTLRWLSLCAKGYKFHFTRL